MLPLDTGDRGVRDTTFSNQVLILLTKMTGFLFDQDPPLQLCLQLPGRRLQTGGSQSVFSQGLSDKTRETGLKSHQGEFRSDISEKFLH